MPPGAGAVGTAAAWPDLLVDARYGFAFLACFARMASILFRASAIACAVVLAAVASVESILPFDVDAAALAWAEEDEDAAGFAGTPEEEEAAVGDAAPPVLKAANLAATLALAAAMASRLACKNETVSTQDRS